MNYATIKPVDIANGPGVRVSLFVSGCRHHCKGCFNAETWDFRYGQLYTEETEKEILAALEPGYIQGFTLLGGEPFEPENQESLIHLCNRVRNELPDKDIWCFSGFTYEEITGNSRANTKNTKELLSLIDVLVDGRFVEDKKDISLKFRGSSNQRIINIKKTMAEGKVVLWEE
mgnify:CR=1 FL=1